MSEGTITERLVAVLGSLLEDFGKQHESAITVEQAAEMRELVAMLRENGDRVEELERRQYEYAQRTGELNRDKAALRRIVVEQERELEALRENLAKAQEAGTVAMLRVQARGHWMRRAFGAAAYVDPEHAGLYQLGVLSQVFAVGSDMHARVVEVMRVLAVEANALLEGDDAKDVARELLREMLRRFEARKGAETVQEYDAAITPEWAADFVKRVRAALGTP